MSKHFELMQQLERDHSFASDSTTAPTTARLPQFFNGTISKRWASEEALRLVQQVFLLKASEPPRVVVFAAIDPGNGCSQISASVAETLAVSAGGPVCLVDANLRSPSMSGMFGMTNHNGLTNSMTENGPVISFANPVAGQNLWLLSSGSVTADSPSLLSSQTLRDRIAELRREFEFVIVDAPPLTRYSDAVVVSQLADGLVLVLEADSTRRDAAAVAVSTLRSVNVPVLAAVLNKRTFPIPDKLYKRL
jgi:capsular exopolysaccharide synthesis family protein